MTLDLFLNDIKASKPAETCPVAKTLELLNGKWTARIIYELQRSNSVRFGELKKNIPNITNTMLSSTLKTLEGYGIVLRRQFNEIPPHVEYMLTESGNAMLPIFYEIAKWGAAYLD